MPVACKGLSVFRCRMFPETAWDPLLFRSRHISSVHEALVNNHWSSPSSVAQEDMWGGVMLVLLRGGDAASLGGVDQSTAVIQSTNSISRKDEALGWNTKRQVFVFEIHLPSWASSTVWILRQAPTGKCPGGSLLIGVTTALSVVEHLSQHLASSVSS